MLVLSYPLGLHLLNYRRGQITKEVGYMPAVNWTISFIIVFPIVMCGILVILKAIDSMIVELQKTHMLFRRGAFVKRPHEVKASWESCLGGALVIWFLFALGGYLLSIYEWYTNSARPLCMYQNLAALEDANKQQGAETVEIDWAVGHLLNPGVEKYTNLVFSFLAFSMQGVAVAIFFLFLAVCAAFIFFTMKHTWWSEVQFVPDLSDPDRRRGFERFEPVGIFMLIDAIGFYLVFYLSTLQNMYLASADQNILQMVLQPVGLAAQKQIAQVLVPDIIINYSIGWVLLGAVFIIVVVGLILPCVVLSGAARRANSYMEAICQQMSSDEFQATFKLNPDAAQQILKDMDFWPFRYPRFNTLWIGIVLCGAGLVWFRLMPYLFGIVLGIAIYEFTKTMRSISSTTGEATAEPPGPQ